MKLPCHLTCLKIIRSAVMSDHEPLRYSLHRTCALRRISWREPSSHMAPSSHPPARAPAKYTDILRKTVGCSRWGDDRDRPTSKYDVRDDAEIGIDRRDWGPNRPDLPGGGRRTERGGQRIELSTRPRRLPPSAARRQHRRAHDTKPLINLIYNACFSRVFAVSPINLETPEIINSF